MKGLVQYRFAIIIFLILTVATFSTSGKAFGDFFFSCSTSGNALGDFLFSWDSAYDFYSPQGIATDGNGNIYVVDTHNHRIQVINYNGLLLDIWGSLGTGERQFNYPRGIEVDGIGNVYIVDTFNHRVQVLSSDGTFLGEWGGPGIGEGQFYYPQGITVDTLGNVYVADTFNNRIQVFSSEGIFLEQRGDLGTGEGQFYYPYDIAVDELGGVVYVADTLNDRVQAFGAYGDPPMNEMYNLNGFLPPLNSEKTFKIGRSVPVKFKLTDANGDFVSTAQASIMLQQYSGDEPIGNPIEPTSKGGANVENTFRYDVLDDQYIYNLNTKGLSEGMWQIIVFLDDCTTKYAFMFLRK
jgi:DNA-binding beta-propeller fold protein YncE